MVYISKTTRNQSRAQAKRDSNMKVYKPHQPKFTDDIGVSRDRGIQLMKDAQSKTKDAGVAKFLEKEIRRVKNK